MDKSQQFNEYREKYKEFYYNSYSINEDDEAIYLEYEFEIPGLTKFMPKLSILKKEMQFKSLENNYVKNMVFNIGLNKLLEKYMFTKDYNKMWISK